MDGGAAVVAQGQMAEGGAPARVRSAVWCRGKEIQDARYRTANGGWLCPGQSCGGGRAHRGLLAGQTVHNHNARP